MYSNGEKLTADLHFQDHKECTVPIQIYKDSEHSDIGFVEDFCSTYVKMNDTFYHREEFVFISRPGY